MNLRAASLLTAFIVILSVSCSPWESTAPRKAFETKSSVAQRAQESQIWFEDQTEEIIAHAKKLVEKNEKEGAVLDQRWYTLKRFQKYQKIIFGASRVAFYGGLENDVRRHLRHQYTSVVPVENDQEPGEIRLFYGMNEGVGYDLIIIGQNGREVALKTVIRLIYLRRFLDEDRKRHFYDKLSFFDQSLKVFMSSLRPREEFIAFFNRHSIRNPDAVMIGFRGDIRSILRDEGIEDPESYSDESLRVNWYRDANGKKVLLVSIDENRIFGSRAGELIEAILKVSDNTPPAVAFLGIGGSIDEPELVGKIVRPTIVIDADPFPSTETKDLVHLICNKAIDQSEIKTVQASVENVIVETTRWASNMKDARVRTVDQELFHVMSAINSSANAREIDTYVGILVTDNVSPDAKANLQLTLQYAEETISKTSDARKQFLASILNNIGVLKEHTSQGKIAC